MDKSSDPLQEVLSNAALIKQLGHRVMSLKHGEDNDSASLGRVSGKHTKYGDEKVKVDDY